MTDAEFLEYLLAAVQRIGGTMVGVTGEGLLCGAEYRLSGDWKHVLAAANYLCDINGATTAIYVETYDEEEMTGLRELVTTLVGDTNHEAAA